MKKFKFSLDSALKWKLSLEEAALQLFGEASRKRELAFETLQNARRCQGELLKIVRQAREGRQEGWRQVAYLREVNRQEGLCKNYEELLERAKAEEVKAREGYLLQRREAEAIRRLRQKRHEDYQKETNREIEKELEEIMLSREGSALCS